MKKNNIIVIVSELSDVKKLKSVGISTFIFPFEKYSIGHKMFSFGDIPTDIDSYVLINRIFNCLEVDELKKDLKLIPSHIKGIIYEDLSVFNIVREMNLEIELILYSNHFATNSESIKYWLKKGNDSLVISNELSEKEIERIVLNSSKNLIVTILGYNQIMYSRRNLVKNYNDFYGYDESDKLSFKDNRLKVDFKALSGDNGTIILNNRIFNGLRLLNLENIKYFLIDSTEIDIEVLLSIIENDDESTIIENADSGFLNQETIYKLRG